MDGYPAQSCGQTLSRSRVAVSRGACTLELRHALAPAGRLRVTASAACEAARLEVCLPTLRCALGAAVPGPVLEVLSDAAGVAAELRHDVRRRLQRLLQGNGSGDVFAESRLLCRRLRAEDLQASAFDLRARPGHATCIDVLSRGGVLAVLPACLHPRVNEV